MSEGAWTAQPTTLCSFVDSLADKDLAELRGALTVRLCRKNYGANTLEGLLAKWGWKPSCPECGCLAGRNFQHRAHTDAQSAHLRYGALAGTVFTNVKLTLYKIIKIVEVMWHSASPRLIELTCKVSHSTTFLLAPQDLLRRQRLEGLGDPFGTCMDRRDVVLQHQGRARGRRGLSQGQGLHHCGYRLVGL